MKTAGERWWLLGRLVVITLPLWFAWEMVQAPAFTGMPQAFWAATALCARAAAGDAVIVLGLWGLGPLVFRDACWWAPPRLPRYALIALVAIAVQVVVERHALGAGRWGYKPWHPTLPWLGTGLVPVLQALLLVPLTFWLLARWEARRR
jgi:hypothetical protein